MTISCLKILSIHLKHLTPLFFLFDSSITTHLHLAQPSNSITTITRLFPTNFSITTIIPLFPTNFSLLPNNCLYYHITPSCSPSHHKSQFKNPIHKLTFCPLISHCCPWSPVFSFRVKLLLLKKVSNLKSCWSPIISP